MDFFESDGLRLAYLDQGEGEPILLIHGFASSAAVNWVNTGWVDVLTGAGRRVIAMDVRGHGDSDKLYDPARYSAEVMAEDALALIDHLGIAALDVMGYSMGARISAFLGIHHPERVRTLIVAGMAWRLVEVMRDPEIIATALEAPSLADVTNPTGHSFRRFADRNGADLKALAACMRGPRRKITPGEISGLTMPVLIAVGSEDEVAGSPQALAALLPRPEILDIPGRDHMRAVGDKVYKDGVVGFLRRHPVPVG